MKRWQSDSVCECSDKKRSGLRMLLGDEGGLMVNGTGFVGRCVVENKELGYSLIGARIFWLVVPAASLPGIICFWGYKLDCNWSVRGESEENNPEEKKNKRKKHWDHRWHNS
ncbi:unnamed protein product [Gongylonema pulchrum]|uniref:Transmembrane protein n=1 Tax=Gongylonema pulchrum TaxID=637853 RepID=A0A183D7G1_9BILA|nr:unnamed protein product [Gongylonema pulchrum]